MVVADEKAANATLNIVAMVSQSAFPQPDDGQLPAPTVTELLAIMLSKGLIVSGGGGTARRPPRRRHRRDRRR